MAAAWFDSGCLQSSVLAALHRTAGAFHFSNPARSAASPGIHTTALIVTDLNRSTRRTQEPFERVRDSLSLDLC
jgi:hypothetical protein